MNVMRPLKDGTALYRHMTNGDYPVPNGARQRWVVPVGKVGTEYVPAEQLRGAVEAIAAHRAAIERIGTVSVADDESRARAQAKHEADLALWRYGGGSS